ncbi:MAG: AmpG family muropeptide MFS transporter [Nitrospira sp. SB0677_bin_15]|nr:AmpG family muropeptide MFS transporter [Nitrospira sp. SB0667_bin_9]MYD31761.1 AmpG family muropeptide MFS transporter [Nitrospira sp. SB0661_bin_20]MYG40642.1 AmpG family muropeptide MFS transporter [Nitrospira sp. SB0677_bin_15]MYH02810.1 AmpG family muropeptide MFS transporter [Nitrospira sp. SB0675_bin_23]MYJ22510.1 AmpG family muropeptide MFS transporter [Nitrospira sp. SB0673_bin_12]
MQTTSQSWRRSLQSFAHPRVVTMLFLGFSAGLPLLLIFSSLSLWLREAGIERATVTFFSWAALGYSFKFVWAPLVDTLPVPLLTRRLGRRRGWMLLAQGSIIASIVGMAFTNPAGGHLTVMALAAVLLGFSSATQDIVIDAYRIESAAVSLQALMSSAYIAGYRIGMLISGAGALFLAGAFGSAKGAYDYQAWQWTYLIMAAAMSVGVLTTLMISEPPSRDVHGPARSTGDHAGILFMFVAGVTGFILVFYSSSEPAAELSRAMAGVLGTEAGARFLVETVRLAMGTATAWLIATLMIQAGIVSRDMIQDTYVAPLKDFFRRYGLKSAFVLLLLVGVYRISDVVLGVIANVFYQDVGFTKPEIAGVVKTFGLFMTIAGGFLGGLLSVRYGMFRVLLFGALLSAATNLLFIVLAATGHNLSMLYVVISADNLSAGLASAAFVAFLSSLTNIRFTAMQYAIFSSLMTLFPKLLGGYSGTIVDSLGYANFFMLTTLLGLPVLILVLQVRHYLDQA